MVCKAVGGQEFTLTPTLSLKGEGELGAGIVKIMAQFY